MQIGRINNAFLLQDLDIDFICRSRFCKVLQVFAGYLLFQEIYLSSLIICLCAKNERLETAKQWNFLLA